MPRADEAFGVLEKLEGYSLDMSHPHGGSKAHGFALILGVTIDSISVVEAAIRSSILYTPIASTRPNPPYGTNCVIEFPLRGIGRYSERIVLLRTIWEFAFPGSPPRLVSAFLKV